MANTYSWGEFINDVAPSEDGIINVIKVIHYQKNATNEDGSVQVSYHGSFVCDPASESSYIDYPDVTIEDRISWTETHLQANGIDLDAYLDSMIHEKVEPQIITNFPIPENIQLDYRNNLNNI
jgi:hypothetical protein